MKKIITLVLLMILACAIYAEDTYDLNIKFAPKEVTKANSKISIEGTLNLMGQQYPYKGVFDGIVKQTCIEVTKDKTFKIICSYDIKDIQSNEKDVSQKIQPKTIGYEIGSKGKLLNVLDE